ncbi:unnamed protein product [Bursaphelenchus xylophilus]|uniref:(pine wood nematode) hypothetical protein n=1 Tax=Bursaphelenchus xylophilus TaxID=6326 RepID=A0A1I7S3P1_BURXY|nr:unnamed protein product [Bursaphelenchus xylophilus]CAG9116438.1 unnamed protein product [Bursaphelenchus xylophilus]
MGCAPSSGRTSVAKDRRDSAEPEHDENTKRVLMHTPDVRLDVGAGVLPVTNEEQQVVVFIFGGPGSQKGLITQDLAHEFDFVTISVEDIVFSYLPNKVANTVTNTVEMQQLLKRDQKVINLDWIMSMISAKLSTSTNQRFIIDIVPELNSMLKTDGFRTGDHNDQLENFDRRHHVAFALELFISEERLLLDKKPDKNSKDKNDQNKEQLSPELTAFMKGIDEADKGRLEKRLEAFHRCSAPFLSYFRKTKRVVRLDMRVPGNPGIMQAVRQTFTDFGYARNNDFIRVVLFIINERQIADIDLEYYRLRKVKLSDVCHDSDETLSQQIRSLRKFIYRTARPNENILVILNCLNNTDYPPAKRINFIETKQTYLDYYIKNRERRSPRGRCKMGFRAITSTISETCLFPDTMSSKLCTKIGHIFGVISE